jgi:hypothetical protein
MTTISLVQDRIPGVPTGAGENGFQKRRIDYLKIIGISFIVAAIISISYFYFFIFPNQPEL